MKPFKINRDTWHYKLNQKFLNEDGRSYIEMQRYWEPKHNNFCSYWRATMFRITGLTFCIFGVGFLLSGLGMLVYQHPFEVLKGIIAIVVILASTVAMAWTSETLKKRRQIDAPEGLLAQRLSAYKSQICPMVEYEE